MDRKRVLVVAVALLMTLVLFMAFVLTECGSFTCDICGSQSSGRKHTANLLGEKVNICSDCYKELKELYDEFS